MVTSRDYKSFNNENFKTAVKHSFGDTNVSSYLIFEKIFLNILQRHALIYKKTVRANHALYVTKNNEKSNNEKGTATT